MGCGLGCGAALLLLVGGCFAFQAWLTGPGEVLEPAAMLDPGATAHVALRLDLADPPTRDFVETMLAAAQAQGNRVRSDGRSPLVDFFVAWNENRQRRDLARLFPVTAAWVAWPGERDAKSVGAVVVSARGMGRQVIFMDWLLGLLAGRLEGLPERTVAGERVYELPIDRDEVIYAFLDAAGVVVCFDPDSVAPAVERLRQRRGARARRPPTEVERRLASVPADLPLRGAVVARRGEVAQLLGWLAPGAGPGDLVSAWDPIQAATVAGRFTPGGGVSLRLELTLDPSTSAARRERLLADLEHSFGEHWGAGAATVRASGGEVTLDLLAAGLPWRLEETRGSVGQPANAR